MDEIQEITVAGRKLRTKALRYGSHQEIEAAIIANRVAHWQGHTMRTLAAISKSRGDVPESVIETLLTSAVRCLELHREVTAADVGEYLHSTKGVAHLLWMMTRDQHPEFDTVEKVQALLHDVPLGDVQSAIDSRHGMSAEPQPADGVAA